MQMTGYCTTWNGEGDATAGTRQAASDIEFHTDIDEHGVELVRASGHHDVVLYLRTGVHPD